MKKKQQQLGKANEQKSTKRSQIQASVILIHKGWRAVWCDSPEWPDDSKFTTLLSMMKHE
jgi:hypothetical protein